MKDWVKLFISHDRQIVVEMGVDDDGCPQVLYRWNEDEFNVSVGPSWKGDKEEDFANCEKYFAAVDQSNVDKFVSKILELIANK